MTQTKLGSLVESVVNILIGWSIALASQLVIFPLYGVNLPLSDNLGISVWFTAISLVRSYAVRRWFNAQSITHRS